MLNRIMTRGLANLAICEYFRGAMYALWNCNEFYI